MKKLLVTALVLLAAMSLLWSGCGEDNYKSPYDASQGASISGVEDKSINSQGEETYKSYHVIVSNQEGEPLNDIDLWVWIEFEESASSYTSKLYYPNLSRSDFVDTEAQDFEGFDTDFHNLPHYVTDEHGRADVEIKVLRGFAGTLNLEFDIGVDTAVGVLTVIPGGGNCFDGLDNDSDGAMDATDPDNCINELATDETSS